MKNALPLSGITVVSLEHAIAAPLCTRQLADLGARVIKIERRESGDFARHYDSRVNGLCSHFVWTNRSKESMTLDLKQEDAISIMHRLLEKADVLVQNLAPSAAARMGFSYEDLREGFPNLIVCNISGYGDTGPYSDKKAYDLLVQAEAGFLSITGTPDELVKSGISIADIAAGTQAHAAILAGLIQRSTTGKGSRIDISMLEAMVEWMGFPLNYAYEGAQPPNRTGADHASIFPYGAFTTKDSKTLMLGIQNDREWKSFCCDVLGDEKLQNAEGFSTNSLRSKNRELLKAIIQKEFALQTESTLIETLNKAQIAFANVNDMAAVWDHPQLKALNRFIETDTPSGKVQSLLPPGNNSDFEFDLGSVPELGEHTESILIEMGYEETEITDMQKRKVI